MEKRYNEDFLAGEWGKVLLEYFDIKECGAYRTDEQPLSVAHKTLSFVTSCTLRRIFL
jgi:hypothetical protein